MDFLSFVALFLIIFVLLTLAYGMIAIHDIPYNIAKKRNHPHQDAIHSGGWVSLFTLHAIWPFLWMWATAYHPEHGYSGRPRTKTGETAEKAVEAEAPVAEAPADERIAKLEARIAELEKQNSGGKE